MDLMEIWYGFRAWLVVSLAGWMGLPVSSWVEDEAEEEEWQNPHMESETAVLFYNTLEANLSAIWPVAHSDFDHAREGMQLLLTHQVYLLGATVAGASYEISRLYHTTLDSDYEVNLIRGANVFADGPNPEGYFSIRDEMHAFIGESLDGNYDAAVNIVTQFLTKFEDSDKGVRAVEFLSHLLVSVAYAYSADLMEDV